MREGLASAAVFGPKLLHNVFLQMVSSEILSVMLQSLMFSRFLYKKRAKLTIYS